MTEYSAEDKRRMGAEIVRLMSLGPARSANEACRSLGIPPSTFSDWCAADAGLAERYARAREDMIDRLAAETIDIADAPVGSTDSGATDSGAVQKQRLQVDTRKWLLSKLAPKRYGEKLELSGDAANPIAIRRIERVIVGNGPDAAD